MINYKSLASFLFGICVLAVISTPLFCLDYPTREIELISGHNPGSSADTAARLIAMYGQKYTAKPIVVINKPGGGGAKGPTYTASAKPDGYTLGVLSQSSIAQPYLMKGITFNYKKSWKILAQADNSSTGLAVVKGGPYDIPLKDLVRKAKENPESIKIGIGGTWTVQDFTRAVFEEEAGIKFIRVLFPGVAEGVPALLGGHIDCLLSPKAGWAGLYKSGKVNVLALTEDKRDTRHPEIPTFRELGYAVVFPNYHWVAAPAGLPDDIANYLSHAFKQALTSEEFKKACDNVYLTAAWATPAEAVRNMEKVEQLYLRIIKKYNLKPE